MKYVNGTVELCYDLRQMGDGTVGAYLNPFDEIAADADGKGNLLTPPFWAVVRICVIGTANEKEYEKNPLHQNPRAVLGFRLNMTKCCTQASVKPNSIVLGMFTLDLNKTKVNTACFPYVNYTHLIKVPRLCLPADHGGYAVKLVARVMKPGEKLENFRESQDFSVQSISSLHFKRRG